MNNEINFKEEVIVSVHEKQTNRKLEILSLLFLIFGLVLSLVVIFLNLYVSGMLERAKNDEASLIAQIKSPENKEKETLYFLIKDREAKINSLDKSRVVISAFMNDVFQINKDAQVINLSLNGASCELTLKVDSYDKFENLRQNFEKYHIEGKSVVVKSTNFQNGFYKITLKFAFKRV